MRRAKNLGLRNLLKEYGERNQCNPYEVWCLAYDINYSKRSISAYANGSKKMKGLEEAIAKHFEISVQELRTKLNLPNPQ